MSLAHSVAPVGANYGNAIIISLSPDRDGPVCVFATNQIGINPERQTGPSIGALGNPSPEC